MSERIDRNMDIEYVNDFNYEGYQVVRGEFFAHTFEPSFTLTSNSCQVNTACIKKLPDFDYVQILVNPDEKLLAVRPCLEEERDSFRWCSATKKRTPKKITCRMFYAKITSLMEWDPDYRYKMLGKLIQSNDDLLFIFDLTAAQIFQKKVKGDEKSKASKVPVYPEDWKNQFGLPFSEHKKSMQINKFKDYTIISLTKEPTKVAKVLSKDSQQSERQVNGYAEQPLINADASLTV